jgi:hypothetical protein
MNKFHYIEEKSDEKKMYGAGSMFVEPGENTIYCLTATEWNNKNDKVKFRLLAIDEDHAFIVLGISKKNFLLGNSVSQKFTLEQIKSLTKGKLLITTKLKPVMVSFNVTM